MAIESRQFGQRPSLQHMMAAGHEFTDAAMEIRIEHVLASAGYVRKIGRSVADLTGLEIQKAGDGVSKRLVFAAYDTVHDLMRPTVLDLGIEAAKRVMYAPRTRETLLDISRNASSHGVSMMAKAYNDRGDYFQVDDEGLSFQEDVSIDQRYAARHGGCPYAVTRDAHYFNEFTDYIVDTYTEAYRQNMPLNRREAFVRLVHRK